MTRLGLEGLAKYCSGLEVPSTGFGAVLVRQADVGDAELLEAAGDEVSPTFHNPGGSSVTKTPTSLGSPSGRTSK